MRARARPRHRALNRVSSCVKGAATFATSSNLEQLSEVLTPSTNENPRLKRAVSDQVPHIHALQEAL